MILELPPALRPRYSLHCARGNWHIGNAWVTSTTERVGWMAAMVCQIGVQEVQHNARTMGKRSVLCPKCKQWLADRIMRQDFS